MKNIDKIEQLRKEFFKNFEEDDIFICYDIAEKIIKLYEEDEKNTYSYSVDMYNLAFIQQKLGKYSIAVKYYKKVINILEKEDYDINKEEDKRALNLIIDAQNSIGICYGKSSIRKSLALDAFEKALATHKKYLTNIDNSLIDITHNIGCAYYDMAKYDDAIYYHLEELTYRKEKNLDYVDNLNFLGYSYEKKKDFNKATIYFNQALDILKGIKGVNSEEYIANVYYLSSVYYKQKEYQKAIKSYKEVCSLIEQRLGQEHPYLAEALTKLAQSYLRLDEMQQALTVQLKSLNIIKNTVGEKHIYYSTALKRVGDIYYILEDYDKAMDYYEKENKIKEDVIGIYNEEYVNSLLNLINIYIKTKNIEKEEKATEKLLKMVDFDLPKETYKKALLVLSKIYIYNEKGRELYDIYDCYLNVDKNITFDEMVIQAKNIDEEIITKEKKLNGMFSSYEEEDFDDDMDYIEDEEDIFDGIKNLFDGIKSEIQKIDKEEILEIINPETDMTDEDKKQKVEFIENKIKEIQSKIVKELEERRAESSNTDLSQDKNNISEINIDIQVVSKEQNQQDVQDLEEEKHEDEDKEDEQK